MKLWLDDAREMPDDYDVHVETVDDAVTFLEEFEVTHVGFDHDLGQDLTGYDLAKWIEFMATEGLPRLTWSIQSANPVGRKNIEMAMKMADRYWRAVESTCKNHESFPFVLEYFKSLPETIYWYTHKEPGLDGYTPAQLILQDKQRTLKKFIQENFLDEQE